MYSISSDTLGVKEAISATFLTEKNEWGGAAQMSWNFLYKSHKSGSQSISYTHTYLYKMNTWISKLITIQISSNAWVPLNVGLEDENRNLWTSAEIFEYWIRFGEHFISIIESISSNFKAWHYNRFAYRYHSYVHVQTEASWWLPKTHYHYWQKNGSNNTYMYLPLQVFVS